jgi:glycosyltransferase involved in cell wall biosynthesis
MGESPLVSVILPTFGRDQKLLTKAVESISEQTVDDIELIIVDDSPSNIAEEIVEREYSGISWITPIYKDHNGVSEARNTGINASSGKFIAFIDDDDQWKPDKLKYQLDPFYTENSEIGISLCGYDHVDSSGNVRGTRLPDLHGDVTKEIILWSHLSPTPTYVVRYELIKAVSEYFDPRLDFLEDRDWILRLSQYCEVASIQKPLVTKLDDSPESLSQNTRKIRRSGYLYSKKHTGLAATFGIKTLLRFWYHTYRIILRRHVASWSRRSYFGS